MQCTVYHAGIALKPKPATDEQRPEAPPSYPLRQGSVRLDVDQRIARVTIDRPGVRNAIGLATIDALHATFSLLADADLGVVVLTGAGDRAFVSGGDLKEFDRVRTREAARDMAQRMRSTLDLLGTLPIPTVAALNGHAFGGGSEVAIACDIRIAADDVRIGFNQSTLAIMPAWGGVERLVDLVGRSRAMLLLTTGRVLTAAEALEFGLVDEVVPRAEFEERVQSLAVQIATLARDTVLRLKTVVDAVRPLTHPSTEKLALDAFVDLWVAQDHWDAAERLRHSRSR